MEKISTEKINLTLIQQAKLTVGEDFWHGPSYEQLGPLLLTDGPHGLRKQVGQADHLGLNESVPATCFPTASCLACSFDEKLLYEIGQAIGNECVKEKTDILLGPGVNMKRSPLGGRNFEYYSEDPYLAGILASGFIKGVQSTGTGACIKHFACNNQEYARMVNNSIVDERTLHELYLKPFEIAIKNAHPAAIMTAYNQINGVYASENEFLLKKILRTDWHYQGIIVSDWGGVHHKVNAIKSGLNLEMPASYSTVDVLVALENKELTQEQLSDAIVPYLQLSQNPTPKIVLPIDAHDVAYRAALESMVLLKNNHQVLPILAEEKIYIMGDPRMRIQGAGSSLVNPKEIDNVLCELDMRNKSYEMVENDVGFDPNHKLICFVGLDAALETEGCDRKNLKLSLDALQLVKKACQISHRVIIVLTTGSVVELPFIEEIEGLLLTYLPGEAGASALVSLLLGEECPCGHLAETWCKKLEDTPVPEFGIDEKNTIYKERFFIGYRYYDKINCKPLFPFGFGLSYTNYVLLDAKIKDDQIYINVKNTGSMTGKVVIQLYVHDENQQLLRPIQELKNFCKLELKSQEEKEVIFPIYSSYFEYYDTILKQWNVSGGTYEIRIGFSSDELPIRLKYFVSAQIHTEEPNAYFHMKSIHDIQLSDFEQINGPIPLVQPSSIFTLDSTISDIQSKFLGKIICYFGKKAIKKRSSSQEEYEMSLSTFLSGPIRLMGMGLHKTMYQLEGFVIMLNGHLFKGLLRLICRDRRLQRLRKKKN